MFSFDTPSARRRISLTPLIDVVFLLLVFFMLAARFGLDDATPLFLGGEGNRYEGPPRLVEVTPEAMRLNGVEMEPRQLLIELVRLSREGGDIVVLRPRAGASVGRVVEVMELMGAAGFTNLALVEAGL